MTPRRLAFWLVAAAGVAVGHIVGYAAAHPSDVSAHLALGGHAYLPGAASIVVPIGVGAGLVGAVRSARALGLGPNISVARLAAAHLVLFGVQEVGERLADGVSLGSLGASLGAERGVWLGLVAQVAVAWLIRSLLTLTVGVVRLVTGKAPRNTAAAPLRARPLRPTPAVAVPSPTAVGRRGPPRFVHA